MPISAEGRIWHVSCVLILWIEQITTNKKEISSDIQTSFPPLIPTYTRAAPFLFPEKGR